MEFLTLSGTRRAKHSIYYIYCPIVFTYYYFSNSIIVRQIINGIL